MSCLNTCLPIAVVKYLFSFSIFICLSEWLNIGLVRFGSLGENPDIQTIVRLNNNSEINSRTSWKQRQVNVKNIIGQWNLF